MNWIIDDSGPLSEVYKRVAAVEYASFKLDLEARRDRAAAQLVVDRGHPHAAAEHADLAARLASMDEDDAKTFERAKAFVLLHLSAARTSHVGVCARLVANPKDAPDGQTLSISVSEYDGP